MKKNDEEGREYPRIIQPWVPPGIWRRGKGLMVHGSTQRGGGARELCMACRHGFHQFIPLGFGGADLFGGD